MSDRNGAVLWLQMKFLPTSHIKPSIFSCGMGSWDMITIYTQSTSTGCFGNKIRYYKYSFNHGPIYKNLIPFVEKGGKSIYFLNFKYE